MSTARGGAALAALLYLALAVFAYRSVLADPSTRLPVPQRHANEDHQLLYRADQTYVVGVIATNARKILSEPHRLWSPGPCAPLHRPHTLGEHMLAEGLIGALPWLVTRDPILTFHAVVLTSVWLGAMAMYALAYYWTRSVPAAFVAGLLFAFHPGRISNPAHVYAFANQWTPLVLLAAHRLFVRERWRDAVLLLLFVCLQLLESFYQVLAFAILAGAYGASLVLQHARHVPRLMPKLAIVAAGSAVLAWIVFAPYLETREIWGVLRGRARLLLAQADYLPGGNASAGWIALVLAAIGLLDRLRGARRLHGEDPRIALLVGGVLLLWCSVWAIRIPGTELAIPSPLVFLASYIPGVDAVRALTMLQHGVFLVLAFLSAYGVLAVIERFGVVLQSAVGAAIAAGSAVVIFHSDLAARSYGTVADLDHYDARPRPGELALLERVPPGHVLDLPLDFSDGPRIHTMPGYILASAYHGQPVAACYNSFATELQGEVQRLVERLPDPRAADALVALGFENVILHRKMLDNDDLLRLGPLLKDETRIERLDQTTQTLLLRLSSPLTATEDFAALEAGPMAEETTELSAPRDEIELAFAVPEGTVFRHPDPIRPSELVLTWRDDEGETVATSRARALLPVTLTSGASVRRSLRVDIPVPPGAYEVALARAAEPERILATRPVAVR